ncbi:hypothetical protein KIN20_012924 [Parelaphostrongylus tenuis]|uniref:Uncharacterized protein n=1 Tax=Parelaphostrongylus tenuis TaxID=148309 RepID=A0AAD5MXI4_PARTN|nr:hypothetical protein KIN20_012924 [Parelaphostrongylus tenuis]
MVCTTTDQRLIKKTRYMIGEKPDRWIQCVTTTNSGGPLHLSYFLTENDFDSYIQIQFPPYHDSDRFELAGGLLDFERGKEGGELKAQWLEVLTIHVAFRSMLQPGPSALRAWKIATHMTTGTIAWNSIGPLSLSSDIFLVMKKEMRKLASFAVAREQRKGAVLRLVLSKNLKSTKFLTIEHYELPPFSDSVKSKRQ